MVSIRDNAKLMITSLIVGLFYTLRMSRCVDAIVLYTTYVSVRASSRYKYNGIAYIDVYLASPMRRRTPEHASVCRLYQSSNTPPVILTQGFRVKFLAYSIKFANKDEA